VSNTPDGNQRLTIRTLTEADLDEFTRVLAAAFLIDRDDDFLAFERAVFEPSRAHGVFDGGTMIGSGEMLTRRITLPGTGPTPVAAITAVGVAPGHRRRGVLSMIMREQLTTMHDRGEAISILWASEGAIYGRFGYGLASDYVRYAVPAGSPFRPGVDVGGDRVRELPKKAAEPVLREIYRTIVPNRVGLLERTDGSWAYHLTDTEIRRKSFGTLRFAIHPQGYAAYRVRQGWQDRGPSSELIVHELIAANPTAYAALFRYLLDVDLISEVQLHQPTDDPVIHLLADPRAALRTMVEGLWVRLVDLDRALESRTYSVPLDVVLEVTDPFCPWNAGGWRLVVDSDGRARVRRDAGPADVTLGIDDLSAVFLGGTRLTTLAAAGRVRESRPGVVARMTLAFLHDGAPACTEQF
jgi:predicted acetyltransferase